MQAKTFYVVLAIVALVGGGWVAYAALGNASGASDGAEPTPVPALTEAQAQLDGGWELGISKGDPNAPVVVQEFADYQCPACRQFASTSLTAQAIDEAYVKTGKVRWIFFDFPLQQHPNAVPAAEAARCAGDQGAYWRMHDLIFARQPEWSGERNPKGRFVEYARLLGLEADAFSDCLDSDRHLNVIRQSYARGVRLGVQSTPSFFVGRELIAGAASFQEFTRVVERALAAADAE